MPSERIIKLMAQGYSYTQAIGKPTMDELSISEIKALKKYPGHNDLLKWVYDRNDPAITRLYNEAAATDFRKAERGERITPMNRLLFARADANRRKHPVVFRTPGEIYEGSAKIVRKGRR
jgi:hypothetical protein